MPKQVKRVMIQQGPIKLDIPRRDYQPSKAEKETEYHMPGADMDTLRKAFFRTVERTDKSDAD